MHKPQTLGIREFAKVSSGTTPARGEGSRFFCEAGHLWVKTGDLNNGSISDTSEYLTDQAITSTGCRIYPVGTVLVAMYGGFKQIGRTGILRHESAINQAISAIQPDIQVIDPEYLLHYLNGNVASWKRYAASSRKDPNITRSDVESFRVVVLPLPEQRKVAEILRVWDEALEKLTALRAAKLRRHHGLTMALVFGGWQLEHFRKTDEVTPYRWFQLPSSWSCQSIGDLATEISERNGERGQHEVLSCSKHDGFVRSLEYFKKQVFSANLTGYKRIWRGDFGFPSNHVEEGSIGLQNLTDIGVVSPIYTVFRFNPDRVNADYAFATLKTDLYRHIFEVSTSASVDRRGSLRWSEFSHLPFPVPPLDEQEAIADVLRTSQRELDALADEIEAVTRQKRGLMQKLLTGEWRVKLEEPVA